MARPCRVEYAGALYHVMNRGNRRERVFRKTADYELFLDRLGRFSAEFGVEVLSYCLMPKKNNWGQTYFFKHRLLFLRVERN